MSKKATRTSRAAYRVLAGSRRTAEQARRAADARRLADDAVRAAVAAACAAERAGSGDAPADAARMSRALKVARSAAEEAVEHARDAMRAEGEGDAVGAAYSAGLSARAAQRAASVAAATSVISGRARQMASDGEPPEPRLTVGERRNDQSETNPSDPLAEAVDRAARYLVTYDGAIVGALAREEDAILLESELADLDRAHESTSGKCEVIERRTGRRLGGYLITGGRMIVFLRDEERELRYGKRR